MTSMRLPSEEEIRQASQQGEEAVIALWRETFSALADRIQKLEDQSANNGPNSGKPPSSDGYDRKRLFIILGAIGAVILLAWFAVFPLIKNLRASNDSNDGIVTEITLCDMDARGLCIVTFGTDNTDRMVINFQLPKADYPTFYVNGSNKGTDNLYQCETADAVPTSVYCTGIRTPLGEVIDLNVYATDSDQLMARGTVMVSAMVLSTSVNFAAMPVSKTITPNPTPLSSPIATIQIEPTPTVVFTPTPVVAYP